MYYRVYIGVYYNHFGFGQRSFAFFIQELKKEGNGNWDRKQLQMYSVSRV